MRKTLCLREVAERLGVAYPWLCRHREALEAQGFPKPLPVINRYDPRAIAKWMDRQFAPPIDAAGAFDQDKMARRLLDDRATGSAPPHTLLPNTH